MEFYNKERSWRLYNKALSFYLLEGQIHFINTLMAVVKQSEDIPPYLKEFINRGLKGINFGLELSQTSNKEYMVFDIAYSLLIDNISRIESSKRAKNRKPSEEKGEAIEEAKRIWALNPNHSLDMVASTIANKGIAIKSHATIKKWIAPYNPKKKK